MDEGTAGRVGAIAAARRRGDWQTALGELAIAVAEANDEGLAMLLPLQARVLFEHAHFCGGNACDELTRTATWLDELAGRNSSLETRADAASAHGLSMLEAETGDATPLFQAVVFLALQLGDNNRTADALVLMAMSRQLAENFALSDKLNAVAIANARDARNDLAESYAQRHIGLGRLVRGDRTGAIGPLRRSLRLRERGRWLPWQASALLSVAQALEEDGSRNKEQLRLLTSAKCLASGGRAPRYLELIEASLARLGIR